MVKILITGGAGFIGAHLTNKLSKSKKNKILVVDLLKSKGGIPYLNPRNEFIKGDITNKNVLKKIEKWKPEIIYHLAAQSGSEGAYDNPKEDLLTNALGTYLLGNLAKKIRCKKFIYTSTVAVYGNNKKYISEKSDIRPDSIYGVSKYAGELFLKQLLNNTKVKTYIFRLFNTYGPGENLNRFRNFTYIDDCAEILAKSLNNSKLKNFEIFNLASEKKITVKELVKKIIKVKNLEKYKVKVIKGTLGDSFGFDAKNSHLKKRFSKVKFTSIESGLKQYFKWIDKIPKKVNLKKHHPFSK